MLDREGRVWTDREVIEDRVSCIGRPHRVAAKNDHLLELRLIRGLRRQGTASGSQRGPCDNPISHLPYSSVPPPVFFIDN